MTKTFLIISLSLAILLAVLVGGSWLFLDSFDFAQSHSETRDLVEVESPDHHYVAKGYHILGGATVADMTIIVLRPKGWGPFGGTNDSVFIADNLSPFEISWPQNKLLQIKCSSDRGYSQKTSWRDVTIRYLPLN